MNREIATAAAILLALAGCRNEPTADAPGDAPSESVDATTNSDPSLPNADINASLGMLGNDAVLPDRRRDEPVQHGGPQCSWPASDLPSSALRVKLFLPA